MMNRFLAALLALSLLVVTTAPALGTRTDPNEDHKVTVCHALPEGAANAFQELSVDIASTGFVKAGHYKPGGSIGDKHSDGGDIIPPYEAFVKVDDDWEPFVFSGQNWTEQGQAIWNNGCVVPPVEPPVKPEPPVAPQPVLPQPAPLQQRLLQPEPLQRYAPAASFGPVCGDPRIKVTYDNSDSTMQVRFKFIFVDPRTDARVVSYRFVKAGQVFTTKWRWVKGKGNLVRVRGQYQELLAITNVNRGGQWGEGSCIK